MKWVIYFHNKQHPKVLEAKQIEDFLEDLSNTRYCSVNIQHITLNVLVYLYKRFLFLVFVIGSVTIRWLPYLNQFI
ncbi:phage integrase N-terminal SAM-like domain-containing protein [Agarilytica rhodophyticola]|uniref:phage integrase N-terminal SAM-like domain-containing protein n=1 Tax=Agarilytica rhodophyticola TaxID=1737490 RepID=UPI001319F757